MTDLTPPRAFLEAPHRSSRWRTTWASVRAAIGALLGLVPHVMHHIGILAGAALLTGVFGNSLLYAVGLLLSIPLLNRLRKRFGTWKAPAIGWQYSRPCSCCLHSSSDQPSIAQALRRHPKHPSGRPLLPSTTQLTTAG